MRKKNLFILFVLILGLTLSACATKDAKEDNVVEKVEEDPVVEVDEQPSNGKIGQMPPFVLKNIEGTEISSNVFGDYDITIISLWQST